MATSGSGRTLSSEASCEPCLTPSTVTEGGGGTEGEGGREGGRGGAEGGTEAFEGAGEGARASPLVVGGFCRGFRATTGMRARLGAPRGMAVEGAAGALDGVGRGGGRGAGSGAGDGEEELGGGWRMGGFLRSARGALSATVQMTEEKSISRGGARLRLPPHRWKDGAADIAVDATALLRPSRRCIVSAVRCG